jgi:DNA-binding NarL/FixJ family response regulator
MRVVIVGPRAARARLASELPDGLDVVGEAETMADARSRSLSADAFLVAAILAGDPDGSVLDPLTARELEVLDLVAQGLSNKAIGQRLAISDQTVKFHLASIFGKLGVTNRTEAARSALRKGLVSM